MRKPIRRLLAGLALATAVTTVGLTNSLATSQDDTGWGAPAADTGWGTAPANSSDATGTTSAATDVNTTTSTLMDTAWG
jgi:hypothetical protein